MGFQGSGLKNAKTFERGAYLGVGAYQLQIGKFVLRAGEKATRKSGDALIVEFEVKRTSNPAHPVGSKATWYQSLKDKDVAYGAIKEFLYAVLKAETKEQQALVDETIEKVLDDAIDNGKLNGFVVDVQTSMKKTAGRGLDFTVHAWSPAKAA